MKLFLFWGAFQIVAAQVVCEGTNHGLASAGFSTDRNHSDNLKCTPILLEGNSNSDSANFELCSLQPTDKNKNITTDR